MFSRSPERTLRLLSAVGLAGLGLLGAIPPAAAAPKWQVEPVALSAPVRELRQVGQSVFVRTDGWLRLDLCEGQVCAKPGQPPAREVAPDGIPYGYVTVADGAGIRSAWYIDPTGRYDHGVLGDAIEAAGLAVEDGFGRRYEVQLPADEVFEDIAPRIADINGDGLNEVITIRSSIRAGAAIAVYGLAGGNLIARGQTTPIGRTHRWLNIAGIADYTGNGQLNIAQVITPHIGGRLEILSWNRGRMTVSGRLNGFSNHIIGTTELGLSATTRVNGDRIPDLVLPSADRRALRMVTAASGTAFEFASVPLDGEVRTAIGIVAEGPPPVIVLGLDDGRLVAVRLRDD